MFSSKQLLNPIVGAHPCGEDLTFSPELDLIAEARRYDDSTLDQGEWVTDIKEANWPQVIASCSRLIEQRSKDLRLAVWLSEASAKVDHFAGLAEGYQLIAGLCDQYWDNLYPLAEDGDQEQRIGNLYWLLTRSTQLVRELPLTEGKGTAYCSTDFESAKIRAANADKIAAEYGRPEEGPKLAELELARKKSSRAFYENLLTTAKHCLAMLNALELAVDARLGSEGPGFSATKDAFSNVIHTITRFAEEAGVNTGNARQHELDAQAPLDEAAEQEGVTINANVVNHGRIQNRAQALAQLRAVAEFFRRTEPHSPVAYLADKAAAWGDMPLHDWLSTVIKDPGSLAHVEELLGLAKRHDNAAAS